MDWPSTPDLEKQFLSVVTDFRNLGGPPEAIRVVAPEFPRLSALHLHSTRPSGLGLPMSAAHAADQAGSPG